MIVVDTNVVTYLFITSEKTAEAQSVFRRDPNWCVPRLWRHEFLNVLATYSRSGGADPDEAVELWRRVSRLLSDGENDVDMELALRTALERDLSAYDAQYAALAAQLGVPLVTEDKKLLEACADVAVSMVDYCAI